MKKKPEIMENVLERRDQIHEMMKLQQWDQVQLAWMEVVETAPQPIDFHEPLVTRLVRRKFQEWLENLYGLLLDDLNMKGRHEEAIELIRMILRWQHDAAFILAPLRRALLGLHKDRPTERIEKFIELSGLNTPGPRIAKMLERFEELVGVSRGYVFRHSRWGLGKVVELDAEKGKVTIDFAVKKGQTFTMQGVKEFLQAIPSGSFVSAMVRDPEALRQRVLDNPAEAVKFVLRGTETGSLPVSDLKKLFLEGLMDESAWKKWWESARTAVRVDPWVDMLGSGARVELKLRKEPRSFADEILGQLRKAATLSDIRDSLRELRRHQDDAEITPQQQEEIARILRARLVACKPGEEATRLGLGYLWEEFPEIFVSPLAQEEWDETALLGGDKDAATLANLVLSLGILETQTRACEGIRKVYTERWPVVLAHILPLTSPRLASWIERTLGAAGEEKARHLGLDGVLAAPDRNPDTFLWAVRQILGEGWDDVAEGVSRAVIFSDVLALLEDQYTIVDKGGKGVEEAKALVSKLRSFVNDTNLKYWRKAVKSSSFDEAKRLLSQVRLNGGLSDMAKEGMEIILISQHPDLKKQSRAEAEEETKKPSFHYVTAAALEARRAQLSHILNVEVPENSKQIGIARDHGDLRENAEYHAAKERQKLLHQQAQELNDLISRARVVDTSVVKTDAIYFGTRFRALDKTTSETKSFTILGIWEAKPEEGILSYLTPLGGAFLNAKPGMSVEVTTNDGTRHQYEILEIEKAI